MKMKRPEVLKSIPTFIKSMEKLITRYEAAMKCGGSKAEYEDELGLKCLLCNPVGTRYNHFYFHDEMRGSYGSFDAACEKLGCPWIVMVGMTCSNYSVSTIPTGDMVYNSFDKVVMQNRIKQIKQWIKVYKTEQRKKLDL
jgi:hypothetical protein